MFFFDGNAFVLRQGDSIGECTVAGVQVGCFPDLYVALAGKPPDHVIAL